MYHNHGYIKYKMSKVKSSDWKHLQFNVFFMMHDVNVE